MGCGQALRACVASFRIPRLSDISWCRFLAGNLASSVADSERGVQPLAREARPQIFGLPRPLSVTLEVQTEYLEATLGLVKCLEISKELIRECVTMPSCCCCMPLLHNHLMDSCSYVRKNTLLAAKGGCICTPLPPLNPPLLVPRPSITLRGGRPGKTHT